MSVHSKTMVGRAIFWLGSGLYHLAYWLIFNGVAMFLPSLTIGQVSFPGQALEYAITVWTASSVITGPAFLIKWIRTAKSDNSFLKYIFGCFIGGIVGNLYCWFADRDLVYVITHWMTPWGILTGGIIFVSYEYVKNHVKRNARRRG